MKDFSAMRSSTARLSLIDRAIPAQGAGRLLRDCVLALAGSLLLALSAKVQVPLIVPITLQSLVVLVIGASFGARLGALTVLLYLAQGALGLPVFAGTPEKGIGILYMLGPTGGFLVGFVLAAALAGALAERGWSATFLRAFVTFALAHGVMFAAGFVWLAALYGPTTAWAVGVAPFAAATLIKTALGAALMPLAFGLVRRFRA
jgi:biotin transport system substrate-specific component